MFEARGGVVLGSVPAEDGTAAQRLVDWTGVPFGEPAQWEVLARLAAQTRADGAPLFPEIDEAAAADGEQQCEPGSEPEWSGMPGGPELNQALASAVPARLDDRDVVELVRAHARMIAHHEAQLAAAIAELARRPGYGRCTNTGERHDPLRAAADEVSAALRWSPAHADTQVRTSVELVEELPATWAALNAGRVDAYRARVIVSETEPLRDAPEARAAVESAALDKAENKTGPQLRSYVRRKVIAAAPQAAEQRRNAARQRRRVDKPVPATDGMAAMYMYGPAEDLAALWTAVDAAARARRDSIRSGPEDDTGAGGSPTLDELRFDVLADVGWSALQAGHLGCCADTCAGVRQRLGTRHGRAAAVQVTVPLTTLIGADEQGGELHGFGPVTAPVARRIAAEGTWRRLLTDPASGALLDYGRTRYRPPADLAEHVIARDRTCRFPTCTWPADAGDIDHSVPAAHGGPTSAGNVGAWHRRHHNGKTHHRWRVLQPEPGRFVVISPAGLRYDIDPEVLDPRAEPEPDPPPTPQHDPRDGPPGHSPPVYDPPPF